MKQSLIIRIEYVPWISDTHEWRASTTIEQQQYNAIGTTIDRAIDQLRDYLNYLRTRELRHAHFSDGLVAFIENKQESKSNDQ